MSKGTRIRANRVREDLLNKRFARRSLYRSEHKIPDAPEPPEPTPEQVRQAGLCGVCGSDTLSGQKCITQTGGRVRGNSGFHKGAPRP